MPSASYAQEQQQTSSEQTTSSQESQSQSSEQASETPAYMQGTPDGGNPMSSMASQAPSLSPSPNSSSESSSSGAGSSSSETTSSEASSEPSTEQNQSEQGSEQETTEQEGEETESEEESETDNESEGQEEGDGEGEGEEAQEGESEEDQSEEETEEQQGEQAEGEQGEQASSSEGGRGRSSGGGGKKKSGKAFLQTVPLPKLGIVTPLIPAPPKPAMERADKIQKETGKPPQTHHAQIQDTVNRASQGIEDAQRQMVLNVESISRDTRLSAEEMADEIPGVVAACVASIKKVVKQRVSEVEAAGAKYNAHIQTHGVLTGDALNQSKIDTTQSVYNELQDGADHIEEARVVVEEHFDAKLVEAQSKIFELPVEGSFEPIQGPDTGNDNQDQNNNDDDDPGEDGPSIVSEAETELLNWLPDGASIAATNQLSNGASTFRTTRFLRERVTPSIGPFLEPTQTQLDEGQETKAREVNSDDNRNQFTIMALGLTAPVAEHERNDENNHEENLEQNTQQEQQQTLTAAERAQQTLEQKTAGVVRQLEEKLQPKLIKNIRKAGRKSKEALLDQGNQSANALLTAAAQMAESYRDIMTRMQKLFSPNKFLDGRSLIPKIKDALQSAKAMKNQQIKSIEKQAGKSLEQLKEAKKEHIKGLWKATGDSTDSLGDVVTQTRFDFMLFAEQMTGEMTVGREEVINHARDYADGMAENIVNMSKLNDERAVPRLQALAAGFLNGRIGAALGWQKQVLKGHVDGLKGSDGRIQKIWGDIATDLNNRSRRIDHALDDTTLLVFDDPDQDSVISAIGDVPAGGQGALKEAFKSVTNDDLLTRIGDQLSGNDLDNALNLLDSSPSIRAQARLDVANQSGGWFGYNQQARESALRGMTAEERATLNQSDIDDTKEYLEGQLRGTEETISTAYLDGNRQLAMAARLQEARRQALRQANRSHRGVNNASSHGDQAMVDFVAGVDRIAQQELSIENNYVGPDQIRAFTNQALVEYANLETPIEDRPLGGYSTETAREFVINQFSEPRNVVVPDAHGHYRVQQVATTPGAQDFIRDALTHGPDSDQAKQSRAVFEVRRAREEGSELSETTQMRLTQALENPRLSQLQAQLNAARTPEDRERISRQLEEERTKHQGNMAEMARRLGAPARVLQDPAQATQWLGQQVGDLFAREGQQHSRYGQELVTQGRASMFASIALATDKSGTHEDLLLHAYRGRSRAEIEEVEQQWADQRGENLNSMLGIREQPGDSPTGGRLSTLGEVSGDVAMQLEQLALGEPKTDLDRLNLARLQIDQQERGTGFIADRTMEGSIERQNMEARRERMARMIVNAANPALPQRYQDDPMRIFNSRGVISPDIQARTFNEDGSFRGDALAFTNQTNAAGLSAQNYQAEIDRQESMVTGFLTALTIVVSIALMFIPGVNMVAAGILTAVIGGALTMGAKYGMRGERYGWEEAATDMAQTGIEAATAGIGGAMAGGLGKTGVLFKAGETLTKTFGQVGGAIVREAITGAVSNAAQLAIQDDTFKDGTNAGIDKLLRGAVKGAAVGAISAGVSEKIGGSLENSMKRGIQETGDVAQSQMQRLGQILGPRGRDMFKEGASEFLGSTMSEGAGLLMDYANGDFKGTFKDALKQMGQAGLRDMISGVGRSGANQRNRARFDSLMASARQKQGNLTTKEMRALRLAGISAGVMDSSTSASQVMREVEVGRQARSSLPEAMQPYANRLNADSLDQLNHFIRNGFESPDAKLDFIRGLADQMPDIAPRDILKDFNLGSKQSAKVRAQQEVEAAALVHQQKTVRNQVLSEVPGPARKALRDLDVSQMDGLSKSDLKQLSKMIASGRIDQRVMEALAQKIKQKQPDADTDSLLQTVADATQTSRRAQNADTAQKTKQRQQLQESLGEHSALASQYNSKQVNQLQKLISGDIKDSDALRSQLYRKAKQANPELTRDGFDLIIKGAQESHQSKIKAEQQDARQQKIKQMDNVPESHQQTLSYLREDHLLDIRIAQQQAGINKATLETIVATTLKQHPELDATQLRKAIEETLAHQPKASATESENKQLRKQLLAGKSSEQQALLRDVPIIRVSDSEFQAMNRWNKGDAVTMILDGKAVVVIREGADISSLREEGFHALQLQDPAWREKLGALDERNLARWNELSDAEKMALYSNKIDIEIDAQHRNIRSLEAQLNGVMLPSTRRELQIQLELVKRNLSNLQKRQIEVQQFDQTRMMELAAGVIQRPNWLDRPARLFQVGDGDDAALSKLKKRIEGSDDSEANQAIFNRIRKAFGITQDSLPSKILIAIDGIHRITDTMAFMKLTADVVESGHNADRIKERIVKQEYLDLAREAINTSDGKHALTADQLARVLSMMPADSSAGGPPTGSGTSQVNQRVFELTESIIRRAKSISDPEQRTQFIKNMEALAKVLSGDDQLTQLSTLLRGDNPIDRVNKLAQIIPRTASGDLDLPTPHTHLTNLVKEVIKLKTDQNQAFDNLAELMVGAGAPRREALAGLLSDIKGTKTFADTIASAAEFKRTLDSLGDTLSPELSKKLLVRLIRNSRNNTSNRSRLFDDTKSLIQDVQKLLNSNVGGDSDKARLILEHLATAKSLPPGTDIEVRRTIAVLSSTVYTADITIAVKRLNGLNDTAKLKKLREFADNLASESKTQDGQLKSSKLTKKLTFDEIMEVSRQNYDDLKTRIDADADKLSSARSFLRAMEDALPLPPDTPENKAQRENIKNLHAVLLEARPWIKKIITGRNGNADIDSIPGSEKKKVMDELLADIASKVLSGDLNMSSTAHKAEVLSHIRNAVLDEFAQEVTSAPKIKEILESPTVKAYLDRIPKDKQDLVRQHLEATIKQREKYALAEMILKDFAENGAELAGWDQDRINAEISEAQSRFRAKVTEAVGEIDAFITVSSDPKYKDFAMEHGFASGTGFDQVWVKRDPNNPSRILEVMIVEAKGPGAGLQDTQNKGFQMSAQWVAKSLTEMKTPLSREIMQAIKDGTITVSGVVAKSSDYQTSESGGVSDKFLTGQGSSESATESNQTVDGNDSHSGLPVYDLEELKKYL